MTTQIIHNGNRATTDCLFVGGPKNGWRYKIPDGTTSVIFSQQSNGLPEIAEYQYSRSPGSDIFIFLSQCVKQVQ